MNIVLAAGLVFCLGATIVSIISTAIPYWLYADIRIDDENITVTVNIGLWTGCIHYHDSTPKGPECINATDAPDWWKSVQALMILGILFLALSTFLGCLYCKDNTKQSLLYSAIFTVVLGGIAIFVAVIVFGAEEKDQSSYFHACFYLALIAGVDSIVAAALMAISKRHGGYSSI